ncbi:hypothetical protein GCM10008931_43560 [Oceanobacillus oncorhynchi subsp. oncorhynchi]|uniref:hypothetical protein n=1 Tax=Oceanobacillus oncorhynchi TaxID=545501 RepID=UPI0031E473CB
MKKNFITYPKTEIPVNSPEIEVVEVPLKEKMKIFITGYVEDYLELPTVEYIQQLFKVHEQDAHMAIVIYGNGHLRKMKGEG